MGGYYVEVVKRYLFCCVHLQLRQLALMHNTGLYDSRFSNSPSVKHSRTYKLVDSEPIYADRAELVEYVQCHESPMVGHYPESTTEAVMALR